MKTKLILAILLSSTMIFACESGSNQMDDEAEVADSNGSSLEDIFELTLEDIEEEQLELEKKLNILKNSDVERKSHDYDEFKPEIEAIELKLDSLENYVSEFKTAQTKENQKLIYDRYKVAWEEVNEDIEAITSRFNDLKVMEN